MTLHEPAVTLSDFGLAIACGWFAGWLARQRRTPLGVAFVALFGASALAALLGGITHGFLPDPQAPLARVIWTGTLAAIGGAAFACWAIGGLLVLSRRGAGLLAIAAGFLLVGYLAVILWVSRSFAIAVANYAPAAAFLLIAFGLAYRRRRSKSLLAGVAEVVASVDA